MVDAYICVQMAGAVSIVEGFTRWLDGCPSWLSLFNILSGVAALFMASSGLIGAENRCPGHISAVMYNSLIFY